jgi:hypothetical protein
MKDPTSWATRLKVEKGGRSPYKLAAHPAGPFAAPAVLFVRSMAPPLVSRVEFLEHEKKKS